jgi:hypothetical protein
MLPGVMGVASRRFVVVLGLCAAACTQDVEDNLFDSAGASATTPVSAGVGTNASPDDDGDTERDDSSSGEAETTGADDAITGPLDDTTDDGPANPTIGPLDDSGSSGPVDPTIDPTLDPTLDDGAMDDGGLPGGDCCTAHGGLGCNDAGVEACVCGLDDVCCSSGWDDICVSEAASCGAPCMGGGGGDVGDCCTPHLSVGCSNLEIEGCVCAFDGFCCATEWDDICVSEVFDCGYDC